MSRRFIILYSFGLVSPGRKLSASLYRIGAYDLFTTRRSPWHPGFFLVGKKPFEGESRQCIKFYHEARGLAMESIKIRMENLERHRERRVWLRRLTRPGLGPRRNF
jgi:hypothetical protein